MLMKISQKIETVGKCVSLRIQVELLEMGMGILVEIGKHIYFPIFLWKCSEELGF